MGKYKVQKGAQDSKRGKLFQKLVRAIITAAREGGGDPSANVALKMPLKRQRGQRSHGKHTKAIKRGTGELEGASTNMLCTRDTVQAEWPF